MDNPAVEGDSPLVEATEDTPIVEEGEDEADSPNVEATEESPAAVQPEGDQQMAEETPAAAADKVERLTKFPLGRVKHLMKLDPDTHMASQESVFLVTKALEMFVESLAKEAFGYTEKAKKKTLAKTDVDKAVDTADCLAFLEGAMDD